MTNLRKLGLTGVAISMSIAASAQDADVYQDLERFGQVLEQVQADYVEEVSTSDLIDAAINGMLTSLDPHSNYLGPEAFEEMQESTTGEFGGLGIDVTQENGVVKVVAPIDGTPAAEAGLESGDFITHLDGESLMGMSLNDAVGKLRGPIGSTIEITIIRGTEEPFDVEITRDVIKVKSARVRLEGDVAVIRLSKFDEQTMPSMLEGLKDIEEELEDGQEIEGYVLDLRSNPGGLLVTAIEVSDAFLEEGEIVSTRGRDEADSGRELATKGDVTDGKPVVVVIDGGSASASEIVAGALQDHQRAVIVGTQSFGKGSVQTVIPFDRTHAMRLTTARYYTPSGRSIQGLGVEPDVYVEDNRRVLRETEEEPKSDAFSNFGEGDLLGALSNDSLTEEEIELLEKERAEREEQAKLRESDAQLSYAFDIIHALSLVETE